MITILNNEARTWDLKAYAPDLEGNIAARNMFLKPGINKVDITREDFKRKFIAPNKAIQGLFREGVLTLLDNEGKATPVDKKNIGGKR